MSTKHAKTAKKAKDEKRVKLSCRAPAAQVVFVAGTFNEWNPEATPMVRDDEGEWTVALDLPPGRYEFKFFVDGQWCCDPGHDDADLTCECVPNPFGTMNRALEVSCADASRTQP